MSTRKVFDLAVATGSYTDAAGATKHRYQNVGAVMQGDDGRQFMLVERWFNPAGVPYDAARGNSILVGMFEPKGREERKAPVSEAPRRQSPFSEGGSKPGNEGPRTQAEFEDDIPF